jgi:hypothetical protein
MTTMLAEFEVIGMRRVPGLERKDQLMGAGAKLALAATIIGTILALDRSRQTAR